MSTMAEKYVYTYKIWADKWGIVSQEEEKKQKELWQDIHLSIRLNCPNSNLCDAGSFLDVFLISLLPPIGPLSDKIKWPTLEEVYCPDIQVKFVRDNNTYKWQTIDLMEGGVFDIGQDNLIPEYLDQTKYKKIAE